MNLNILKNIGLNDAEVKIYNVLLEKGELNAGMVIKLTGLKRGDCYNKIYTLKKKGLIEEFSKNRKKYFRLEHPNVIGNFIKSQEDNINQSKTMIGSLLPELISQFNLISGKPGVSFFEGIEGIKKVLDDTLYNNPDKELLTFSDVAGYMNYLKDWNVRHYAPERNRLKIFEKVIIPDDPKAVEYMKNYKANKLTDILFVDHKNYPFKTEVNIYNGKVSFVTFAKDFKQAPIGAIIENMAIFETLKSVFDFNWSMGKNYLFNIQPKWLQEQIKK